MLKVYEKKAKKRVFGPIVPVLAEFSLAELGDTPTPPPLGGKLFCPKSLSGMGGNLSPPSAEKNPLCGFWQQGFSQINYNSNINVLFSLTLSLLSSRVS